MGYLIKTTEEFRDLQNDQSYQNWPIFLDKGYIGLEADTQGLRKLTPIKKTFHQVDILENQEKSKQDALV